MPHNLNQIVCPPFLLLFLTNMIHSQFMSKTSSTFYSFSSHIFFPPTSHLPLVSRPIDDLCSCCLDFCGTQIPERDMVQQCMYYSPCPSKPPLISFFVLTNRLWLWLWLWLGLRRILRNTQYMFFFLRHLTLPRKCLFYNVHRSLLSIRSFFCKSIKSRH